MAPFTQDGSSHGSISTPTPTTVLSTITLTGTTTNSYSTKGSHPSPISSITSIPSSFSTETATPTYISKGPIAPTDTSLRGSQPPSKQAMQSTTLAFVLVLTLLLGIALGVLAWKKGCGLRRTVVMPLPQRRLKPSTLQRNDSNATLVNEASFKRQRDGRGLAVETREMRLDVGGGGRHVEGVVVEMPKKTLSVS